MWAAYDGDHAVGFVMISDGIPADTLAADADIVGPYYLWRLLIDEGAQRQGYGTRVPRRRRPRTCGPVPARTCSGPAAGKGTARRSRSTSAMGSCPPTGSSRASGVMRLDLTTEG